MGVIDFENFMDKAVLSDILSEYLEAYSYIDLFYIYDIRHDRIFTESSLPVVASDVSRILNDNIEYLPYLVVLNLSDDEDSIDPDFTQPLIIGSELIKELNEPQASGGIMEL